MAMNYVRMAYSCLTLSAIYLPDFIVIKKGYLAFVEYWNSKLKTYNKYLKGAGKV